MPKTVTLGSCNFNPSQVLFKRDYVGMGLAFMEVQRFDGQKQLKWEARFNTSLNGNSKDHIIRVAIEYEF